ncbi:unnamed protein product [Phaedon cochleariae]|uniref:Telomere-associated protein RIF1 n=1 Tax=Phaedon cochleariae TaxID=80249 RepID=A0A9P0GQ74_PHACE|nr:unnamed protein product [Phaedon cochleariae]
MSVKAKQKKFKEDLSSIPTMLENNPAIDQTHIPNQIILIKTDLMSQDEIIRKRALDMLESLLNQKTLEVQTEIVKLLNEDSENEIFHSLIGKSVKKEIIDNIMKAQNFTDILLPWQNLNTMKLNSLLEDVFSNELPKEKCKYFFMSKVIPAMMLLNTEKTLRNTYIEIAFLLSRIIPISELTAEELEKFLKEINTKYIGAISQLRDSGFLNWHKLWIFLVRFCDKNIHNSMDLTNRLLRVVEFAFRNSSVEQRLKGYDCWKELIDNASLDQNHICSSKQIKLLITPLRAKFSKQEVVICKRFDTFVYLLEKLQQKAMLCLPEFLEFCFGSIGDNKNCSRSGQGRSIPQLWIKSTKVLVEIIGHSHGNSIDCLNTKDIIKLEEPIINHRNIQTCYKIIINSVSESCILLKDVEMDSKRMEVIKCMWVTVFDLVVPASESNREKYFQILSGVLDNFINQSTSNPYFQDLVVLVFTVLMSFDKELICECIKLILLQLLTILFTSNNIPVNISENFKQALMHSFSKIIQEEDKVKMMNIIMNCFANLKSHEENISNMAKIWLFLASELISDLNVEKIEEFSKLNEFFLWPALNMHRMEETSKKLITVNWLKIYKKLCQDCEVKKLQVMKDLEKIFKNNPLLSSNVISLLNIMSQFETKFTQDFVNKLMNVSSLILVLPNLKSEDEHKISTLVMQYFEPALECYKTENDEVIKNVSLSIEHILKIHGGFRILEPLTNFLRQSPKEMRTKYSKHLENLLLDLYNKESDVKSYNAKELSKVLAVFSEKEEDTEKKTFVIPTGRSARIANLAKNSPKSPNKQTKAVASPTTLRLFGKDLDTMSPLKLKGSQLNNTPPKKSKIANTGPIKSSTKPSINDESSSEFVEINTEIELKPEKLSDHQREVMKKRREDIPALYQDLSQSMSQDMFSSKSNSKEAIAAPKVVVEYFEPISISTEKNDRHWGIMAEEKHNKIIDNIEECQEASKLTKSTENSEPDLFSKLNSEEAKAAPKVVVEYVEPILISTEKDDRHWGVLAEEKHNKIIDNIEESQEASKLTKSTENSEPDLFSNASNDPITHKSQSSDIISASDNEIPEEESTSQPGESNMTKIEQKISADLFSDENPLPSSVTKKATTGITKKKIEEDAEEKKKRKMEAELSKLKMDIVGAAEFVGAGRRTRLKERLVKPEENTRNKTSPKSEKGRKSLSLERNDRGNDLKVAMNRRKSVGAVITGSYLGSASSQSESIPESNDTQHQENKIDGEINESLKQFNNNPQVEIKSALNEINDKKETPVSSRRVRKTKQATQKISNEIKNSMKSSQLFVEIEVGEDKSLKKELIQENVAQVEMIRNRNRKSSVKRKATRKNEKEENKIDIEGPVAIVNELYKKIEDIPESNETLQKVDESSHCTPQRGQKRKYSTDDDDEDIIQSSQESATKLTPLLNSSKKKLSKISLEQNNEESTMVQEKTVTAADFVVDEKNVSDVPIVENQDSIKVPVVVIEKTDVIKNVDVLLTMEAQTEDLLKEYDEAVNTQDLVKEMQEEQTEEVTKLYEESEDVTSLEIALKQFATLEKEIEESGKKLKDVKDENGVLEDSEVDKEIVAEVPLEANTTQDTTLTHETTQDSSVIQDSTQDDLPSGIQDTQTQPQMTQDTPTQDSHAIYSSEDAGPPVLYFDLPKKPKLTESEQMMCRMDTMSICLPNDSAAVEEPLGSRQNQEEVELTMASNGKEAESIEDILASPSTASPPSSTTPSTPSPRSSNLPSSPVTVDTPNRTSELLDNTMDISPINSKTSSPVSEVSAEIPKAIAIFFREEDEEVEEKSEEKDVENHLEEGSSFSDECETEDALVFENPPDKTPDARKPPLLRPESKDHAPPKDHAPTYSKPMNAVSPVPTKLFLKRRGGGVGVVCSPSTGRIKRLMSHFGPKRAMGGPAEEEEEEIDEGDILRFTRDIPSPLAVPRSGILKRKLSDVSDGDGFSPCAKRKRVNFSDPCLTSKKIFLKDDYKPSLEAKRLFDPVLPSRPAQDELKDIFNGAEEINSESECLETEPSLEIINPMILRKDRPIYPKLVDCKDDVLVILKRVTSPIFITAMTNKLKTKNIKTIGDLAQQSESEINRIPFKVPVVANVYKALDSYYKMKNGVTATEPNSIPKLNGIREVEKKAETVEVQKVDVATEMRSLVEKASKENNTLEDLAKILLSSMDKQKIIGLVKNLDSPITVEDFMEETNHNQVLKRILDQKDPSELLENIHQNMNQAQRENLPWEKLLRDRPVSDLKRGITEAIEQKLFSRTEIIENCFLPLIQTPSDIAGYLKSLSVLDFGDVVVERLENENAAEFFCRIMKSHHTFTPEVLMKTLCDSQVLARKDLLRSFQVCLEAQSDESRKEMMVEMFSFISENLDLCTLGSFHVDFINKLMSKAK